MQGIDPQLLQLSERALALSKVDFSITCGMRTKAEQLKLYRRGLSHTLKSKHLIGEAVDVAAWWDGEVRWEIDLYIDVAVAFRDAGRQLAIPVRWGGAWSVGDLCKSPSALEAHLDYVNSYVDRKGKPFLDFVHFELSRAC